MPICVFVFTDIEGSTRRWAQAPELMEAALAQHDQIVHGALAEAGGTVFKHTGDGACATFSSVRDAIAGAAAAQRRLSDAEWTHTGPLKVRMAIHAGEATQRAGDWFGPALNRTARLMGIAHGGQVVLSGAAVALASDSMPDQFALRDLGVHRLRDLAQPEQVWQLVGDGLEGDFPPLRSLDGYRGNLPTLLTSFLGRDAEVDALADQLAEQRLVTLVGPGGVGKTRLALQTAARSIDAFRDGAWFVDLARLADATALDHAVITTLRFTPRRDLTERQIILEAVRDWHALLVVDNCEHMVTEAGSFVADVLASAPGVVLVATSRQPLHLAGERVWHVDPLEVEGGAAQLFIERAGSAHRDFAVGVGGEDVVAICRRLDGIPLAIELAAARMRSMTPAELLARLDQRFRLLGVSPDSTVEGRNRSLQATVDWSFELLSPPARALFARLSVFPGSFDLDAAHAACAETRTDELTTLDLLDTLVDKSLVTAAQRRGRTRYSLLETMRQYGRDTLTPTELEEARRRHAEHFAGFVERAREGMRSADDVPWVGRVDDDLDNIRAAVEHALGREDADLALRLVAPLEPYGQRRRNSEIWAWAEAAIALPASGRHPLVVSACVLRAFGGHARDNPPEAVAWAGRAMEFHSLLNLPPDPQPSIMMGYGLGYEGRIEEGAAAIADAIAMATSIGPDADIDRAEGLFQAVFVSMARGSPDVELAEEVLALAHRLGNVYLRMRALLALGLAVAGSDAARGVSLIDEAVAVARTAEPPFWLGSSVVLGAAIHPEPRDAIRRLATSLDEYRASGTQQWIRRSLRDFLGVFSSLGRHETVALLDGCAAPFSTRPEQGAAALRAARQSLGPDRYAQLRARGADVSDADLADLVRREIDAALEEPDMARGAE